MLEKVITWWRGLKWYYKYPATILVVLAAIAAVVAAICMLPYASLMPPRDRKRSQKQVQALDDLHRQQVDTKLEEQEADVAASEADTKKHDAVVAAHGEKLKEIENKAREDDVKIIDNAGMTVSEINEWRRRQGR